MDRPMAWSEWLSSNIYFQIFMKQIYFDWKIMAKNSNDPRVH